MEYRHLIDNSAFNELIDKYLNNMIEGIDAKEYFKHFTDGAKNVEKIIPVLGIQGAGKSSLLNSILMDDNILPTDVDETTCVPVEVRYGKENNMAEVHFYDKDKICIAIKELEKYVHNEYNPANELNVSKIVIYNDSDILKDNLVLVDLPGVGSLTPQNQKTTLDYVEKLVSAIFMIRTIPPITKTESNFINTLWPKLSNTIFIQNKWNDESDEEAEEAKSHNLKVLQSISNSYGDEQKININIVNVYEAVTGKFSNDLELYNDSGIINVIDEIESVSKNFNKALDDALDKRVEGILSYISNKIQDNINIIKRESKENEIEKEKKIDEIKSVLKSNKKKIREADNFSYDEINNIIDNTEENIKVNIENLSTELRRVINGGIVDGKHLSIIYNEQCEEAINIIMDELLNDMSDFTRNLSNIIELIKVRDYDGNYTNTSEFNKKSAFKFEKAINPALGIGGGILGGMAIGSIGGVPGVIVGATVGIVCSLIGRFLNRGVKKIRVNHTIEELEPAIRDLKKDLEETIINSLKEKRNEIEIKLEDLQKDLQKESKRDIENIEIQYSKKYDQNSLKEYEEDLLKAERIKVSVNG